MLYDPLFAGLSMLQIILFGCMGLILYIFYKVIVVKYVHQSLLLTFVVQTAVAVAVGYLIPKVLNIHQ